VQGSSNVVALETTRGHDQLSKLGDCATAIVIAIGRYPLAVNQAFGRLKHVIERCNSGRGSLWGAA